MEEFISSPYSTQPVSGMLARIFAPFCRKSDRNRAVRDIVVERERDRENANFNGNNI